MLAVGLGEQVSHFVSDLDNQIVFALQQVALVRDMVAEFENR